MKIGQIIKNARKEAGLSQREFAKALHVSDKTVSSYEVGRITPKFETIKQMSRVVDKPITYFDNDSGHTMDESELESNLKKIEMELIEIKKILQKRKKR